jgi:hypothetical protein
VKFPQSHLHEGGFQENNPFSCGQILHQPGLKCKENLHEKSMMIPQIGTQMEFSFHISPNYSIPPKNRQIGKTRYCRSLQARLTMLQPAPSTCEGIISTYKQVGYPIMISIDGAFGSDCSHTSTPSWDYCTAIFLRASHASRLGLHRHSRESGNPEAGQTSRHSKRMKIVELGYACRNQPRAQRGDLTQQATSPER